MKLKVLSHDPPRGLEGELQDVLVVVSGGEVEDGGDVDGPACGPCWPHTSPPPPCPSPPPSCCTPLSARKVSEIK